MGTTTHFPRHGDTSRGGRAGRRMSRVAEEGGRHAVGWRWLLKPSGGFGGRSFVLGDGVGSHMVLFHSSLALCEMGILTGRSSGGPASPASEPACGRQITRDALVPFKPITSQCTLSDPPQVPPPLGGVHTPPHMSLGIHSASSSSLCVALSVSLAQNPLGVGGHL